MSTVPHVWKDIASGISPDSGSIDLLTNAAEAVRRYGTFAHRKKTATHRKRVVRRYPRQCSCKDFRRRDRDDHDTAMRSPRLRSDVHAPTFSEFVSYRSLRSLVEDSVSREISVRRAVLKAIVSGGTAVAALDAVDAVIAFKAILGLAPVAVYQFVASGMLGQRAFDGGLATAILGFLVHIVIAFSAAAVFAVGVSQFRVLRDAWIVSGLAYGIAVYVFMNFVVIPLSAIAPAPFSLALLVNGIVGHALLVGLPISYFARRQLASVPALL
jgi:hypothetical protein